MDKSILKTPASVIEDIIQYLESKEIDREIIKQFLDELEKALKAELAAKIAESIVPEKYEEVLEELGENATDDDILTNLGITDNETNDMLVKILEKYHADITKTLNVV